jgi:hypothetical protein
MTSAGFPHSETLGSQLVCQLPEDYRRLQRPSSAPSAKASTNVPLKTSATLQSQKPRQHTPRQPDHQDLSLVSLFVVSGLGKIQRCSRPLCSSQATDEPTKRSATTNTGKPAGLVCHSVTRVLSETPHLSHPHPTRTEALQERYVRQPVASGPNSVLGKPP